MTSTFINRDGKKYILTSVKQEMHIIPCKSCSFCDYGETHIECGVYRAGNCPDFFCYKLVKEEKPKMKLSELNFKVITGTLTRNEQIFPLLSALGFDLDCNHMTADFVVISGGCLLYKQSTSEFDTYPQTEIVFREAVKLLKNCESESKKTNGQFVEYDMDENGKFSVTMDNTRYYLNWFDINKIEQLSHLFAGWLWNNGTKNGLLSNDRFGLDMNGKITQICQYWVKSLIPMKIRFWVKE